MRPDRWAGGERVAAVVASSVVAAARTLVGRWGPPWMHRRVAGEKLGVWIVGMTWIAAPTLLALWLF